jgi:hypothetical protein
MWHDIASAPRDGRPILIKYKKEPHPLNSVPPYAVVRWRRRGFSYRGFPGHEFLWHAADVDRKFTDDMIVGYRAIED